MEKSRCPLCGSLKTQKHIEDIVEKKQNYSLYFCPDCSGQYWTPFKNPGAEWYSHDERYAGRNHDPILKPNEKHRGVIEYFRNTKGKVFDIGCGVGNFLAHAVTKGWEGWGIDFDPDAIKAGRTTFNLSNIFCESLEGFFAKHSEMRFNLVTFFDVFEHVDNHNDFLARVRSLLTPEGFIALSVPYRHGWRWLMPADLPPRHLTRWDEKSIGIMLEKHGFHIEQMNHLPATIYYIVLKLKFRYGKWTSFGLVDKVKKSVSTKEVLGEPLSPQASSYKVRLVQILARIKDGVIFGIPAVVVWGFLLFTRKRYTDMWLIAKKIQMSEKEVL